LQQFQQVFQQLGQDLQSGNLSAAQSDFATLQQLGPQNTSTASSQSNNPIAQAFNQLSQDLQSGNLSAAQQDYTTLQQALQAQAARAQHHRQGGGGSASGTNEISRLLEQLGTALQSGNLSAAQQTYSALVKDFQQFAQNNGLQTASELSSNSSGVSVNA
jgi:outer membrane protein assembly factor BamD (BamD/ComL family)